MKIYALCLVKNEDDVVRESLLAATKWADKIFVYDNGSNDKTWDIVNELAKTNDHIVPWRQDTKHYKNNLFGDIFNGIREVAKDGDWFCYQFPADEFYIDNPKEFLAKVPKNYHVVKCQSFNYQLTHEDLEEFEFKEGDVFDMSKIKYYRGDTTTEKRFFKYRKGMEWPAGLGHPKHIGIIYPKKIRLKHFQYRSPHQIQLRLDTRRTLVEDGYKFFKHAAQKDWKEKLLYRKDLLKDEGNDNLKFTEIINDNKINPVINFTRKILHRLRILP